VPSGRTSIRSSSSTRAPPHHGDSTTSWPAGAVTLTPGSAVHAGLGRAQHVGDLPAVIGGEAEVELGRHARAARDHAQVARHRGRGHRAQVRRRADHQIDRLARDHRREVRGQQRLVADDPRPEPQRQQRAEQQAIEVRERHGRQHRARGWEDRRQHVELADQLRHRLGDVLRALGRARCRHPHREHGPRPRPRCRLARDARHVDRLGRAILARGVVVQDVCDLGVGVDPIERPGLHVGQQLHRRARQPGAQQRRHVRPRVAARQHDAAAFAVEPRGDPVGVRDQPVLGLAVAPGATAIGMEQVAEHHAAPAAGNSLLSSQSSGFLP
jgi:hypothetical protein